MPIYSQTIKRQREDNFRRNLETLNEVIVQYTLDKQRAPKSLDDLKTAGYIESVPDDITGEKTWETEEDPEMIMAIGQTEGGIYAREKRIQSCRRQRKALFGMVDRR